MSKEAYTLDELELLGKVETRINGLFAVVVGKTASESIAYVRGDDGLYRLAGE